MTLLVARGVVPYCPIGRSPISYPMNFWHSRPRRLVQHRAQLRELPAQYPQQPCKHIWPIARFITRQCGAQGGSRLFSSQFATATAAQTASKGATQASFVHGTVLKSRGGISWPARVSRRLTFYLYNMEKEDWILFCISLGWCGIFAGAAAFNTWWARLLYRRPQAL